jgi:hypothetical protein
MNEYWINYVGPSMSPLLQTNDQVLIEPIEATQLQCGDIILFLDQSSRELTLHRLIELPLQTKGDFSLGSEYVATDSILGRAIGFERLDYFRKFPIHNSKFNKLYLFLSKKRMEGRASRRMALVMLFILTKVFELCSDKTKLNHNKEQFLTDL